MNKHEFITKLNGKLFLLSESERLDIIDEYISHIELKVKDGKSESEAIKDFGDIDELADEILEAYHIDNSRAKTKNLDMYIRQGVDYISRATERLLSFSSREIARLAVEFVLVLIVVSMLSVPFQMAAGVLNGFFSWLPYPLYTPIRAVIDLVASIGSFILGILIIYSFINKKILDATPDFTRQSVKRNSPPTQRETASSTGAFKDEFVGGDGVDMGQPNFHTPNEAYEGQSSGYNSERYYDAYQNQGEYYPNNSKKNMNAGDFVINLIVISLKVLLFLCGWVPGAIITTMVIVATILMIILYFSTGVGFIGLCIAGVGCCVMGIAFIAWLTQVIMGGKKDEKV
ncbi:MAG: DUF1700 domain-containing protein [Oscillospiraceae bacterium]